MEVTLVDTFRKLLHTADVVTLHLPFTAETDDLIGAELAT